MSTILSVTQMTVCMFLRSRAGRKYPELNLGWKTREPFSGCLVPHGGKVDPGETLEECLVREVRVETRGVIVDPSDLERVCIVTSRFEKDGTPRMNEVHFYIARAWEGKIRSSDEVTHPDWYDISKLPYGKMPLADEHYFPRLLLYGEKLRVEVRYSPDRRSLLEKPQIEKVSAFVSP